MDVKSGYQRIHDGVVKLFLSVPVRIKIVGIMTIPVLILGLSLNFWVRTGLSDWLSYLLSDDRVVIAMQAGSRSVLFITFLAAITSIVFTFLLMFILTKPLLELRYTALRVSRGKLSTRAKVWADDEIGDVALAMNVMIDQLVQSQEELREANRRLEAMNRVAMAAGRDLNLTDVLRSSLSGLLEIADLEIGWVYLLNPEKETFTLACTMGLPEYSREMALISHQEGFCVCQEEFMTGKLGHSPVIRQCYRGGEEIFAKGRHITIPLEARGIKFGLVNLLCSSDSKISEEKIELLGSIGAQVSEIVSNVWLHERLVEKENSRQALLAALVRAQEDERARLARELHDGAGQTLTSMLLHMMSLKGSVRGKETQSKLDRLCTTVSGTIEQIRDLSYRLRPAALEELGLQVALHNLVENLCSRAGIESSCKIDIEGAEIPIEIQITLYRIAQESLTNVIRHAKAANIFLELFLLSYAVCLRIEDDGCGFDPDRISIENGNQRLGLISMQERTEIIGGTMEIYSSPGEGTSIHVKIPLVDMEQV